MTEKELQECVRKACDVRQLLYYHTHDSRRSPAGFPDCVIVTSNRIIFAELKAAKGRVTVAQQGWLDSLADIADHGPITVCLWRPEHWESGSIWRILEGEAPRISTGLWRSKC